MREGRWVYRRVAVYLDLCDEADAARYAACVKALRAAEEAARGEGTEAFIAGLCGRLRDFFDGLFGEGAGARLIGEANNAREAMRCYGAFLRFIRRQAEAARMLFSAVLGAYDPARAARED